MNGYAAFLRGINVGGHKIISMAELRDALTALGFQNVRTLLASGNALFETPESDPGVVAKKIEAKLRETFGHEIGVIVRARAELQRLAAAEPFRHIPVTPETRLYVTFLAEEPKSALPIPYESPEKDFRILSVSAGEVCSVLVLTPNRGSTDAMDILEKEFGRKVTTRNWNTITKILNSYQE